MSVWLSTREYAPGDVGPAGGLIFYVNPNHATDGWRYLEAAPFDQSAGRQVGLFPPGDRRRARHGHRHRPAEHARHAGGLHRARHGRASVRQLQLNGVRGWFLPSRDELAAMYTQPAEPQALGDFQDRGVADNFSYWASSQQTADMAAHIDFADLGRLHCDDKDFPRRVRAIRAF